MLVGKEYSKDRPLICDVQLFWINPTSDTPGSISATSRTWYPSPLWRLQLDDGTWSAYVGLFPNAAAEAGFRCWTKQDDESFKRLGQDPKFIDVLPWQAHDLILKLGSDAPMPKRIALQDYQMQLLLLEQQNKRRLMMARQEQDASSPQSHDPPLGSWTTETQYPSNEHGTTTDVSAQPDCVLESVPACCTENLQHNASVPALSSGFESTPGPYGNAQIDTGTLPDAGVEAEFAEFDWDALLSADLNSGSDSNYLALVNGENLAFDFDRR